MSAHGNDNIIFYLPSAASTWPMMIGPGPRIRMVLMSVLFFITAPVFQASKGGRSFDFFGGATTAVTKVCRLTFLDTTAAGRVRPAKKVKRCAAGTAYSTKWLPLRRLQRELIVEAVSWRSLARSVAHVITWVRVSERGVPQKVDLKLHSFAVAR